MDKNKEKKKTLTIASNFKKKIDTSSFQKNQNKKSFSISNDKKNTFRPKNTRSSNTSSKVNTVEYFVIKCLHLDLITYCNSKLEL